MFKARTLVVAGFVVLTIVFGAGIAKQASQLTVDITSNSKIPQPDRG
jgi:hypothetical protein